MEQYSPLQYPSLFVRTTFWMTDCRWCMKSKIFWADSFVAPKLSLNSLSVGLLSLQTIGVCTAVISSWPKSAQQSITKIVLQIREENAGLQTSLIGLKAPAKLSLSSKSY